MRWSELYRLIGWSDFPRSTLHGITLENFLPSVSSAKYIHNSVNVHSFDMTSFNAEKP